MAIDMTPLDGAARLLIEADLEPVQGARFQPTGFPDLGAAVFQTDRDTCLLVESAQSMANRLELVSWDETAGDLVESLRGLSYVKIVNKDGSLLSSSILEAHRLNSAYIEKASDGACHKAITADIGAVKDQPIARDRFIKTVLKYDIGSLIHGVFLESIDGRLRIARALSAFIEAEGVRVAASGGVKVDRVQPGKDEEVGKNAKEGFGNVTFARDEYTAERIVVYFSLDLAQIRGYGLGAPVVRLLTGLALFKIAAFLAAPMRLRTACDLERTDAELRIRPPGFRLPSRAELEAALPGWIAECRPHFADERGVTVVTYVPPENKKKGKPGKKEQIGDAESK